MLFKVENVLFGIPFAKQAVRRGPFIDQAIKRYCSLLHSAKPRSNGSAVRVRIDGGTDRWMAIKYIISLAVNKYVHVVFSGSTDLTK